jgi:exosortase
MDALTYPQIRDTPGALKVRGTAAVEIGVTLCLLVLIYHHTAVDLFQDWWNEPSLSQGLLIPPLAFVFAWLDRKALLAIPSQPSALGLLAVSAGCLTYLLGKLGAEYFLQRISMVVVLAGLIWIAWGAVRLRRLAFPLTLLATMVPLPTMIYNALTAPLQLFASAAATYLSQLCGVSIYRDGNIIHLAHISLGVEEACSGLNSFSALVVAALLLGYFLCNRMSSRMVLLLISAPLSIAVNVLRVAATAVLADYNAEFALGFYHMFAGWMIFLVGFLALLGMAKLVHAVMEPR